MVVQGKITFVSKNRGGYFFIIGLKNNSDQVQKCMKRLGYDLDTQEVYDISSIYYKS